MRPYLLFILACACALAAALGARADDDPAPTPAALDTTPPPAPPQPDLTDREVLKAIARYRRVTWHWQRVMGHPVMRKLKHTPPALEDRLPAWRRVAKRTVATAQHPPHARAWTCIHRFEGSWADPNAPYYGGLQMDLGFQRTYGAYLLRKKGTANRWTPLEQMWVAERAYRAGRGFYPWPNTARSCGLI